MATGEGFEQLGNDFWRDPWVKYLRQQGKSHEILLFLWTWSGPLHRTSGLLSASLNTVRSMIALPLGPKRFRAVVESATQQPGAGLVWFPDREYWWVKAYIRRREDRPNLITAAIKELQHHPPDLVGLVVAYNRLRGLDLEAAPAWKQYLTHFDTRYMASDTLRERFGDGWETLLQPFEQTNTNTNTKTSFAAKLPAATCPWCRWREGHPGDAIPEGPRFRVQRIHDLHRAHFGECLVVTAKEQGLLKRAVARYTEQRVLRWWGEFIRQESKIGHSLAVFCSNAVLTRLAEADPETKATAMKAREAEMLAETARMRGNK